MGRRLGHRLDGRLDGVADRPDDLPDRRDSIPGDSVVGSWTRLIGRRARLFSTRTGGRLITETVSLLAARIGRCQHTAHWSDPTYPVGGGIEHRGDWCDGATPGLTSRRCRRSPRPLIGTCLPARCCHRSVYGDRVVPAYLPEPWMKCRAIVSDRLGTDQFRGGRRTVGGSVRTVSVGIASAQRDWSAVRQRCTVPGERAVTDVSGTGQYGSARQEGPGCHPTGPTDEDSPSPSHPRGMSALDHRDRRIQGGVDGRLPSTDPGDQSSGGGPGARLPTTPRGHRASPAISSG